MSKGRNAMWAKCGIEDVATFKAQLHARAIAEHPQHGFTADDVEAAARGFEAITSIVVGLRNEAGQGAAMFAATVGVNVGMGVLGFMADDGEVDELIAKACASHALALVFRAMVLEHLAALR